MLDPSPVWLIPVVLAAAVLIWYYLKTRVIQRKLADAEARAEELHKGALEEGERVKKERLLEAREEILDWRTDAEAKIRDKKRNLEVVERESRETQTALQHLEESLQRKQGEAEGARDKLTEEQQKAENLRSELNELRLEQVQRLESIAGITAEEAKRRLSSAIEEEARHDAAVLARRIEDEAREKAEVEARKIVVQAIQRCAAEHVVESSISVVDLPSDDMKGRIIGREGRNIRALEKATGVDLIVDDTPEAVILSAFDPLRREIARRTIEELIQDGRIHPARIEEVVSRVSKDMDKALLEEGEQTAFELGIHDMHQQLLVHVGRLKYRSSYGQNVLAHSRQVAFLAGLMAEEVGANSKVCVRGGLLHDVGKAVDQQLSGTHLQLGVELVKKYGESREVTHAVEAHHFDVPFDTIEAVLVQAADAISAARPGARREVLENYVRRLEQLETIASSFHGVSKAFALQAGREIRIIVESSEVSDEQAFWISKDIAKRIEKEVKYPGQIKVTVIREMRAVDYAK